MEPSEARTQAPPGPAVLGVVISGVPFLLPSREPFIPSSLLLGCRHIQGFIYNSSIGFIYRAGPLLIMLMAVLAQHNFRGMSQVLLKKFI